MQTHQLFALALLIVAPYAGAQSTPTTSTPIETPAPTEPEASKAPDADVAFTPDSDTRVNVSISPYVWLTTFSGDVTIRDITVDASVSFEEVLEESDRVFGLMGAIDVEYNRFVFEFDGIAATADFSESRGVFVNGEVEADVTFDAAWLELFAGYRLFDRPLDPAANPARRLTLDAFVGGRFTAIEVDATLTATGTVTLPDGEVITVGQSRERSQSESWMEPFVGARLGIDLSEHWHLNLRADAGGFGVSGSDFSWQTIALVGYRWHMEKWNLGLFTGYRAVGQDYSDGDFGWNAVTHGPLLGAEASFAF